MSAIALAHMGDAVYETLVRTWLCVHGTATGKDLHRATIALVCAPAQAEKMQKVLPLLTDEEQAVYKRGRNANVHTMSRSATPAQYQTFRQALDNTVLYQAHTDAFFSLPLEHCCGLSVYIPSQQYADYLPYYQDTPWYRACYL